MKLYLKQDGMSLRARFDVKDENNINRFSIEGELLSGGKRLHIHDANGKVVAFIRQKIFSVLPLFIVEIDGREVCKIMREFTFGKLRYKLEGLPWKVQGDFMAHNYIVENNGKKIMSLSKKVFSFVDSYELDIADPNDELICLCVTLAVNCTLEDELLTR